MSKLYRLTARAQMHGEVREPGYQFVLEDGERGPTRSVSASHYGAQIADHLGTGVQMVDEPLYEEVKEPEPVAEAPAPVSADDELKRAQDRVAELEAELAALKAVPAPQPSAPAPGPSAPLPPNELAPAPAPQG